MIGSPDLLVFRGGEGFVEASHHQDTMPNELSLPLVAPSNPWSTAAQFHRDFILVAEFSEQVGPQPVMTIPDDPLVLGSFDLNHFSVRIMSVDYQAAFPAPANPSAYPGPRINFTEDSRVVMGDSANGAFAYVQHMTLYDLEARGFVRPFCMAYVSSDQGKLMERFGELSACFTRASDSLKTGNRRAFASELQRKLQELEYTRLSLQQGAELPDTAEGTPHVGETDDGELEALERSILNYRELLRQVSSYPNRKLKQPGFLPYDPTDHLADPFSPLPPTAAAAAYPPGPTSSVARLERRLKTLEELSDAYFVSVTVEQLTDTERRLRGDRSALHNARLIRDLSRRLPLTNFLFDHWDPDEGQREREQEEEEEEEEKGRWPSLERFFSCTEEPHLGPRVETEGRGSPAAEERGVAEMAGSVSSGDSIEVLGTERSYRTQQAVTGEDHRETAFVRNELCFRHAPPEAACSQRVRAYATRGISEDSIEVLSTTDSIINPEDLQAITEEDSEDRPTPYSSLDPEPPVPGAGGDEGAHSFRDFMEQVTILRDERKEPRRNVGDRGKYWSLRIEGDSLHRGEGSAAQGDTGAGHSAGREPVREDVMPEITAMHQVAERAVAVPSISPTRLRGETMASDHHVKFSFNLPLSAAWPPPCTRTRTSSVDEASQSTSSSKSPTQTHTPDVNLRLNQGRKRKAGLRALRFIQQNSFSQHAVFCLLSGRPLIVIGGDESRVRKLVSALALFLPASGPDRNNVLPFLAKPLQLTDLLTWRLIGLHRTSSATSLAVLHSLARYSRYLALLDLDQRTLRCPTYSGSLIGRIANRHSSICRGRTYLLHLESCLTALANQALLYTFHPVFGRDGDDNVGDGEALLLARGFCSSEDDLRVMRFLSDLIKQYHAGRGPPVLIVSYRPTQIHKHMTAT
ncbi:guanine nucleotide exchange protein smcr8b [Gadus chalcogrammus]|uniref:guanine nucleotide exchange protein smcr8b n=1 Tax=Gadus chalcogrammus TaxID=1042646 RepID=UPI0024C2E290|nr:guanine nucleotide exchange protein smcr8b [Gadus chalcogrammus]XP_056442428.1 guanine nucleotide exchange protein smcr8b [Gadus chalcogrammus]